MANHSLEKALAFQDKTWYTSDREEVFPMTEKVQADMREICGIIRKAVPTLRIYLFGSYAYGQPHQDSDYDIYVVLPDDGPKPLDAAAAIRRALLTVDTGPIDILAGRNSTFYDRCRVPSIEREVYGKGVLLYGQENDEQRVG